MGIWGGIALGTVVGIWRLRGGVSPGPFMDAPRPRCLSARRSGGSATTSTRSFSAARQPAVGPADLTGSSPAGGAGFATFQPTFLYELIWNLALAAFLVWLGHHRRIRPPGLFALYVAGYSASASSRSRCGSTPPTTSRVATQLLRRLRTDGCRRAVPFMAGPRSGRPADQWVAGDRQRRSLGWTALALSRAAGRRGHPPLEAGLTARGVVGSRRSDLRTPQPQRRGRAPLRSSRGRAEARAQPEPEKRGSPSSMPTASRRDQRLVRPPAASSEDREPALGWRLHGPTGQSVCNPAERDRFAERPRRSRRRSAQRTRSRIDPGVSRGRHGSSHWRGSGSPGQSTYTLARSSSSPPR